MKYCMWQAPLLKDPYGSKLLDLPLYARVEILNETAGPYSYVKWLDNNNQAVFGWVNVDLLDEYSSQFHQNIVLIASQTPNPNDAAQYSSTYGYNLCGELSVLYCAGWFNQSMDDWLNDFKIKKPSIFNRLFYGGKSRTTGLSDLDDMLSAFEGYPLPSPGLDKALTKSAPKLAKWTPGRVQELLTENRIIAGVRIDAGTGRLRGSGIGHWIVLEKVEPERYWGMVTLYNPFPDTMEIYSWSEFIASAGQPFGILIRR